VSCGGDSPSQPQPTLVLNLTPSSATLNQGDSVAVTGTATAGGTFTGGVTVTLEGWPSGLTASLGAIVPAGANSAVTMILHVATNMPAGVYPLTIRAAGSGITADATFTLTVVAVSAYTLSVPLDTITLAQGTNGNRNVSLSRINFAGNVALAAENLPTGVTAAFAPNPTGTNASVLTLTVGGSVAPGTYNLTIRGTATGLADRTDGLTLTVFAPIVPAFTIDASPDTLTISQGGNANTTVSIARVNGHTASVNFDLPGAPSGISASFAPHPASGASTTATVQVGVGVAPGGYDVTIRGQDGAIAARTTNIHVIVTAAPAYTLDPTPDTITLERSSQGQVTIAIARTNFAGAITLSVLNAPTGVTSAFDTSPTSGNSSTLTLTVGASVALGTHALTLRGVATGLSDRDVPITLIVTQAVGFTIGSLADLTIQQGQSGERKVVITRTGGFTGSVSFVVSTNTPDLTASVNPTSTTGDTVTVTATAALTHPVSTSFVTVTASASGEPDVMRSLDVNVTAGPQSGNVILDFQLCSPGQTPVWLAARDGNGAWFRVTNVNNRYQFDIQQSTAGVAWATGGSQSRVQVMFLTQAEILGNGYIDNCAGTTPAGTTATFTLAGLAGQAAEQSLIAVGGRFRMDAANASGRTLTNVPLGTYDVVGVIESFAVPGTGRVYIRRAQAIAANQNLGTIDVALSNTANVSVADTATITIGNLGDDDPPSALVNFLTSTASNQCLVNNWQLAPVVTAGTFKAFGVPASARVGTDYHEVVGYSFDRANHTRTVTERFQSMVARTVNLGAELAGATISVLSAPFKRLEVALTMPAEYNGVSSFSYVAGTKVALVMGTSAYFASTSQTLTMPDLSGLSGWDNNWVPAPGDQVSWTVLGNGSTGQCAEGARTVTSQLTGVQP